MRLNLRYLAMVLIVPVALGGGWLGTRHYLLKSVQAEEARVSAPKNSSSSPVRVSRVQPSANEVLLARLRQENENYKIIVAEYEERLRDAIAGWSAANVQKAKLDGRYPHDTRVRPGTGLVTAIAVDEVWVRGEDGKPAARGLRQLSFAYWQLAIDATIQPVGQPFATPPARQA